MRLIRLVKVHYSVPQLARQDLDKCRQLMDHSRKVQMAALDRRDQVDNKDQQVERKVRQLAHSRDQVHLMVQLL